MKKIGEKRKKNEEKTKKMNKKIIEKQKNFGNWKLRKNIKMGFCQAVESKNINFSILLRP